MSPERMSYRELVPPPALRPYVDRFWSRARDARDAGRAGPGEVAASPLILPDGCIDVLIDVRTGAASVVGTMTRAVLGSVAPESSIAAVRFKPGAARALLRVPAAELTDRRLPADELGCRWLSTRARPDGDAVALAGALAALERSLLERLPAPLPGEVLEATRRLLGIRPPTVDALARELGRSRQHLARQFGEHVGVGPKEFARVARMQRAVAAVQGTTAAGLAELAIELGYYDQAHLSREFDALTGLTPRAVRHARDTVLPIRSLWLEA